MAKDIYDISKMRVTNESYEKFERSIKPSKYEEIFSKVTEGMRLVCPPEAAAGLSSQLQRWLEKKGHTDFIVRHRTRCADGMGGIWWMRTEKPATKPVQTTRAANAPWPEFPSKKLA